MNDRTLCAHPFYKVALETGNGNAFEVENISAGCVADLQTTLLAPISGTLSVHDSDIGDTLTASVIGNATFKFSGSDGSTTLPGGADIAPLIDAGDITFVSSKPAAARKTCIGPTIRPVQTSIS